ncbi:transporter substrate-binding domain-containing protein [Virgibacillus kekensis]|uniref:Transporter substrate-binding domain-containing protein n=1 Tax=Virgibacillus kekensis TaxID=202261 RepID=A0ABV9DCX4_9BACI
MRKLKIGIFMTLMLFVLAACGGQGDAEGEASSGDSNGYNLIEEGKLNFASSGEFRPFSYMEGGEMDGYDVAVANAVAEKLGLEAVANKAKFSGIVTGVKQGRYDVAVASHTITDKRLKQVDFSEPYYYSGPVIYTRPDSDIEGPEDLKGKEISVSRGSTYVDMAKKYTDNIPQVDSDVVALQSLAKGHHDAVITDAVTGSTAIEDGLEIVAVEQLGVSKQAIAVPKDNDKLLEDINKALQELKESGKLAELAKEYVGADITKEPENVSE